MNIVTGTADTLPAGLLFDMAHYRYRVFVERLGWQLQHHGRLELDQFDRRDTLYVIARQRGGELRGVARLLPTDQPYLLATAFAQLLPGRPLPRSPEIWELSRFAAVDLDASGREGTRFGASEVALALLRGAMQLAAQRGARARDRFADRDRASAAYRGHCRQPNGATGGDRRPQDVCLPH